MKKILFLLLVFCSQGAKAGFQRASEAFEVSSFAIGKPVYIKIGHPLTVQHACKEIFPNKELPYHYTKTIRLLRKWDFDFLNVFIDYSSQGLLKNHLKPQTLSESRKLLTVFEGMSPDNFYMAFILADNFSSISDRDLNLIDFFAAFTQYSRKDFDRLWKLEEAIFERNLDKDNIPQLRYSVADCARLVSLIPTLSPQEIEEAFSDIPTLLTKLSSADKDTDMKQESKSNT